MYLCAIKFSIRKPDVGKTLELPPSAGTKDSLESLDFADSAANCDNVDLVDLAEDLGRLVHRPKMMLHLGDAT